MNIVSRRQQRSVCRHIFYFLSALEVPSFDFLVFEQKSWPCPELRTGLDQRPTKLLTIGHGLVLSSVLTLFCTADTARGYSTQTRKISLNHNQAIVTLIQYGNTNKVYATPLHESSYTWNYCALLGTKTHRYTPHGGRFNHLLCTAFPSCGLPGICTSVHCPMILRVLDAPYLTNNRLTSPKGLRNARLPPSVH